MLKKTVTSVLLVAACAYMMGSCGCLCGKAFTPCAIIPAAVTYVGLEFLTDNDAVFDLFQDDFGTGTLYDDRFTAAPTRAEP
jgi:hypothetical protein